MNSEFDPDQLQQDLYSSHRSEGRKSVVCRSNNSMGGPSLNYNLEMDNSKRSKINRPLKGIPTNMSDTCYSEIDDSFINTEDQSKSFVDDESNSSPTKSLTKIEMSPFRIDLPKDTASPLPKDMPSPTIETTEFEEGKEQSVSKINKELKLNDISLNIE